MKSSARDTPWWRFTNVRIWWWKWRYVERMLKRAMPGRSGDEIETAWYCADAGWEGTLDSNRGDVEMALKDSSQDCADEELTYWTNDEPA